MSIDHYYTRIDGKWLRFNMRVVTDEWEYIPRDEIPDVFERDNTALQDSQMQRPLPGQTSPIVGLLHCLMRSSK